MASSQQAHQDVGEKNKAAVEEVVKEAKSSLAKNIADAKAAQHQLALVVGGMRNGQQQPLALTKDHSWQGKFLVKPPVNIASFSSGVFAHQGDYTQGELQVVVGSKGAVVYQQDFVGVRHLGWLLAWYKPDNLSESSRVYVKAGPIQDLVKDWSEVEKKLDESGKTSNYVDPVTGARAYAEINDIKEIGIDKMATVGSVFDIVKVVIPPQP